MSFWNIIDAIGDIIDFFCRWRFYLCVLISIALAFSAVGNIASEPLRWIVGVAILVSGVVVDSRWERAS